MIRSTLTRPLAIALMLAAGWAAAQPPVRAFPKQSFAAKPRVIKAELLGDKVPPGVEQVAVPSSYWRATAEADVTFTRQSERGTTTLHEVNRLPQRAEIQRAVMENIEPGRMRVTVSLKERRLWITQDKQSVSVPLELLGDVMPTQAHLQTLGKVGKAFSTEQARTWMLPDAIVLDLRNNAFFYRKGDSVYPLKIEKIQETFDVLYPSPIVTERPQWLFHMAIR